MLVDDTKYGDGLCLVQKLQQKVIRILPKEVKNFIFFTKLDKVSVNITVNGGIKSWMFYSPFYSRKMASMLHSKKRKIIYRL